MNTGYDDPDEKTTIGDVVIRIFKATLWVALLYSGYQLLTQRWSLLQFVVIWAGALIAESTVLHVKNYGLRRKNRTDKWDDIYYGHLNTSESFNRRATFWWMLGFKDYALQYVDRADWAMCEAQVMLAEREAFIRGEYDGEL